MNDRDRRSDNSPAGSRFMQVCIAVTIVLIIAAIILPAVMAAT